MVSSNAYMWFGIPGKSMQWVPAPKAGFQRNWTGNVETLALEDGRQAIRVSSQKHQQFVGDYFGDYSNPDGVDIDIFHSYASGFYGRGPMVFADPYAFHRNMFAPHWASPSLVEQGWAAQTDSQMTSPPVFGSVDPTGGFGRPSRYCQYQITTTPYAPSTSLNQHNHYIAIPPGYTLNLGMTGIYGSSGAVIVQPFFAADNTADVITIMTPLEYTSSQQTNLQYDGDTYNAVRIFFSRTTTADDASVLIFSMMAQLWQNGYPMSPSTHVPGMGHTGLKIVGSSLAETYNYGGLQKGLNLTFEEVI